MSPSLVPQLAFWLKDRNPLWGFDFDGTLVALADDPLRVVLSAEATRILEKVARRYECVVISGREAVDLRRHVPLSGVHLISNHGGQLRRRDGSFWNWSSAQWQHWRANQLPELERFVQRHGGRLEDKGLSVTVHYRGSSAEGQWWSRQGAAQLDRFLDLKAELLGGAQAWNIVPKGAPTKGLAAARLCRDTGHDSLIYFGDEQTDENVFGLKELPVFGVKVGAGPTVARYHVACPAEVLSILAEFS